MRGHGYTSPFFGSNIKAAPGPLLSAMASLRQPSSVASTTMSVMHELVSAFAAAVQLLKGMGTAIVFVAVYAYWRWLPQPHSF